MSRIWNAITKPIGIGLLLIGNCAFFIAFLVKEGAYSRLSDAVYALLGRAGNAMLNQDASLLFLFAVWLLFTFGCAAFIFWLGRVSKEWDGWDYILYGKAYIENADERISSLELIELARNKFEWSMEGEKSLEILDIQAGINDAAANGKITAYGRRGCHAASKTIWHKFPLIEIPRDILPEYSINIHAAWFSSNNTNSRLEGRRIDDFPYSDIYLNRFEARKWLKLHGSKWIGLAAQREGSRQSLSGLQN